MDSTAAIDHFNYRTIHIIQIMAVGYIFIFLSLLLTTFFLRRKPLIILSASFISLVYYAIYEYLMPSGMRYDLILFVPVTIAVAIIFSASCWIVICRLFKKLRGANQSMHGSGPL